MCSKARSRIGLLFRGFVSRDKPTMVKAYKVYVRPILEYCSVVWSPWQVGLINALENVQRYFTRRLIWPTVMSYSERLALLDLELLEIRRIKADLTMCFKILHNLTCLDANKYFTYDCRELCVRDYDENRLLCIATVTNRGENNFFNRTVKFWNSLSRELRSTSSLAVFKELLNSHDFCHFLKGHV